ncbi:triose-phosphate isomerase [Aequorivita marina]|uniref:triose-phosphate isomerase n=1 Tax=Aequorivita marina TaxID=3073654 RepID=UPI0028740FB7|nr:triose-phosphate isomerase [Aequorivita sp. S2608]MDS1298334.1 triose-phosphate isomerase [Aequorivita sp. S2608]
MRRKIVAGNWKMNNDLAETEMFLVDLKKQVIPEDVLVMLAPPFTSLHQTFSSLKEHPVSVVAQNMHQSDNGAFTGEISAKMLCSVGAKTVILGHSERREIFKEDNAVLAEKVNTALKNDMTLIFCIGEKLEDRNEGTYFELIKAQLTEGLFHVSEESWKNIVIAYEPVWAIGTGKTASPQQAQEMHKFIRETISEKYNSTVANDVSILYGGSVKPNNAAEIFGQDDVDGGLIGGASLKVDSFMEIVNAF